MPLYDYRCDRTGEIFEIQQSFSDDALAECPQRHNGEADICGAPVKKVFSKVGIAFKGDGFYKNDHGANAASRSSSSESNGSGADGGTTKSDSPKPKTEPSSSTSSSSSSTSSSSSSSSSD